VRRSINNNPSASLAVSALVDVARFSFGAEEPTNGVCLAPGWRERTCAYARGYLVKHHGSSIELIETAGELMLVFRDGRISGLEVAAFDLSRHLTVFLGQAMGENAPGVNVQFARMKVDGLRSPSNESRAPPGLHPHGLGINQRHLPASDIRWQVLAARSAVFGDARLGKQRLTNEAGRSSFAKIETARPIASMSAITNLLNRGGHVLTALSAQVLSLANVHSRASFRRSEGDRPPPSSSNWQAAESTSVAA
jgi:hypothetical protein